MSNIPRLVLEKQLRDGRSYKDVEIAEQVGISSTMVAKFLNNEVNIANIRLVTAIGWAKWLERDIEDLYTIENETST